MRKETWWNKREFFTSMGIAILLTAGFLQGYLVGRWEVVIPSYFSGSLIAYGLMRSRVIRKEKQDLAEMEAMEKEYEQKLQQLHDLEQKIRLSMSMPPNNSQSPMQ